MRIVAVSDLHGHLPEIPPCDLLLLAGDLCPVRGGHDPLTQSKWLAGRFRPWLDAVPAERVVGVAGNHDFVFQKAPHLVPDGLRWTYLQDSETTERGLKVYGLPWQPEFGDWAFNANPAKMRAVAEQIPADTDILVMHGPPRGYGDRVYRRTPRFVDGGCMKVEVAVENVGCPHLLDRVGALGGLKLVVFGHIHSGHGVFRLERRASERRTILANVSLVDEDYSPVYGVTPFDYAPATGEVVPA